MQRGKFIVIEGGDGAGKDTQIALLKEIVDPQKYLFVHDPGSTDIGDALRAIVLHDKRMSRAAEFLIYLASRAQLVDEKIRPALLAGITVVSNRFDLSTIAYQVYGRERTGQLSFIQQLSEFALGGVYPDIVILLDCPPEIGLTRTAITKQFDRFEGEKLAFHERVRAGYLAHIHEYPTHHIIDASCSAEEVHIAVRKILFETI